MFVQKCEVSIVCVERIRSDIIICIRDIFIYKTFCIFIFDDSDEIFYSVAIDIIIADIRYAILIEITFEIAECTVQFGF